MLIDIPLFCKYNILLFGVELQPRNAYAFLGLVLPWAARGVSPSADGDQGLCPMEPATFEKVDETFILGYFFTDWS